MAISTRVVRTKPASGRRRCQDQASRSAGAPWFQIDKHSTGGVGDKISIPLAPIVAALGTGAHGLGRSDLGLTGAPSMASSRFPGYRTDLSLEARFEADVLTTGCSLFPVKQVAPADRKLYALQTDRDGEIDPDDVPSPPFCRRNSARGSTPWSSMSSSAPAPSWPTSTKPSRSPRRWFR